MTSSGDRAGQPRIPLPSSSIDALTAIRYRLPVLGRFFYRQKYQVYPWYYIGLNLFILH